MALQDYIKFNITNIDISPEVVSRPPWLHDKDVPIFTRIQEIVSVFGDAVTPDFDSNQRTYWIGHKYNIYQWDDESAGLTVGFVVFAASPGEAAIPEKEHRDKLNLNFQGRLIPFHASLVLADDLGFDHLPKLIEKNNGLPGWETTWQSNVGSVEKRLAGANAYPIARSLGQSLFMIDRGQENIAVFSSTLGGGYLRQQDRQLFLIYPATNECWFYRLWSINSAS